MGCTMARAVVADGLDSVAVESLASLGCKGKWRNNEERDLHRWLHHLHGFDAEPYFLWIDLQAPESQQTHPVAVPVLPPFEVFHGIWKSGSFNFDVMIIGEEGVEGIVKYWDWAKTQKWAQEHPCLQGCTDFSKKFGLWWHMDGGEFYTNSEYLVTSWQSAHATGDPFAVKIIMSVIPHAMMTDPAVKKKVMVVIAKYVGYVMWVFDSGVLPFEEFYGETLVGHRGQLAGQEIGGGYRPVFTGFKSDLKEEHEVHNFENWYKCTRFCKDCFAEQPNVKANLELN